MKFHFSLVLLAGACAGGESIESSSAEIRGRPDVIECRSDDACPRGTYCEPGLGFCFTSSRCYVDGRPSDAFCERTYGEGYVCLEYAPDSHHCVPTEPPSCLDTIACRTDEACPRGSYCEPGLDYCLTPSRCYVNGRPSDAFCRRTYGRDFLCHEYAPGSHHCAPVTCE